MADDSEFDYPGDPHANDPTYCLLISSTDGVVTRTEGPATKNDCITRVLACLKSNGHNYQDRNVLFANLAKGEQVGDSRGWRYKVIAVRPLPPVVGWELQPTLDKINEGIVRVEGLTRANWHVPDQMVEARAKLRTEAENLETLVNVIRKRLDLPNVKAV